MSDLLKHKGYFGTVQYSEIDNILFGTVVGIKNTLIMYHGKTLQELKHEFEEAIDFHLEVAEEEGWNTDTVSIEVMRKQLVDNVKDILKNDYVKSLKTWDEVEKNFNFTQEEWEEIDSKVRALGEKIGALKKCDVTSVAV